MQISNSLVKVCRAELESFCTSKGRTEDQFWPLIYQAVTNSKTDSKEHPLITKLTLFLTLATTYKEQLIQLKDLLLQSVSFGIGASTGPTRHTGLQVANGVAKKSTNKGSGSEISQTSLTSVTSSGISLHNIDAIMSNYSIFTARIIQVLDIIATLRQFKELNDDSRLEGLPRISGLWHLELESGTELSSIQTSGHSWEELAPASTAAGGDSIIDGSNVTMDYLEGLLSGGLHSGDPLPSLKEESQVVSSAVEVSHINEGTYVVKGYTHADMTCWSTCVHSLHPIATLANTCLIYSLT